MKDILILYKNGIARYKDETKITESDIKSAKWFLISTATSDFQEHRCYVLVKPTKLLLFTNAHIEYQLCMKYDCSDDYFDDIATINPVSLDTSSISDLIRMINCADKLNIPNNFIRTEFDSYNENIGLNYMGVQLYRNGTMIYDKYYELKGISSVLYDSYQVTKHFTELYDGSIMGNFMIKGKNLYINDSSKEMTWNISEDEFTNYKIIGLPSRVSNTMILCTKSEYDTLMLYNELSIIFTVFYDKKVVIQNITDSIESGNYSKMNDIIDALDDVYCNNMRCVLTNRNCDTSMLPEILNNMHFIFDCVNLMYRELYPSSSIFDNYKEYDFDSIMIIRIKKNKHHVKEIAMNTKTILQPTDVLAML